MDISNAEVRNLLCDQTINIYLLVKDFNVIKNSNNINVPEKFINRVNSVLAYTHNLFCDYANDKTNETFVQEKMINLLNTLVMYRNSYNPQSYGYRLMNSMFDVINETYITIETL